MAEIAISSAIASHHIISAALVVVGSARYGGAAGAGLVRWGLTSEVDDARSVGRHFDTPSMQADRRQCARARSHGWHRHAMRRVASSNSGPAAGSEVLTDGAERGSGGVVSPSWVAPFEAMVEPAVAGCPLPVVRSGVV